MTFGFRYRLQSVICFVGFGSIFALGCWLQLVVPTPDNIWFFVLCFAVLGPMSLFSALLALHAVTAEVIVSPERLTLRSSFVTYASLDWDNIRSVCPSRAHDSIVLVTCEGRRVRVSTKLDGFHALIAFLARLRPGVVDRSIIEQTVHEP
jgi:hypothetical protein